MLRVARQGTLQPNSVTDADFEVLKAHFPEREIVEIVAVLSLYRFLNRWNGTLQTELEPAPAAFAASLN